MASYSFAVGLLCSVMVCVWASEGSTGPSGNVTFQRYFGYRLSSNASEYILRNFTAENGTDTSKKCREACVEDEKCQGFYTDLLISRCVTYSQFYENDAKFLRTQLEYYEGATLWRKSTTKSPSNCAFLWRYDVRPELTILNDKIDRFVPVSSMDQCQETCSDERTFLCRSAVYNYVTRNCHLSRHDRRSMANLFVKGSPQEVYLENHCAGSSMTSCEFSSEESPAAAFAMDSVPAENAANCERLCTENSEFACRSYTYSSEKGCLMGPEDSFTMAGMDSNETNGMERGAHFQRNECTDVHVTCGSNQIVASFHSDRAFNGRIVSLAAPKTCSFDVRQQFEFNISFSMEHKNNCGIIDEESNTVSAMVMMQYHDSVITARDRAFKIICKYELDSKTVSNFVELGEGNGPPNATVVNGDGLLPRAYMRIMNGEGQTVTTAEVGQTLYAEVTMEEPPGFADKQSEYGLFVNNCEALDEGQNVLLVDEAGCPADPALFEGFHPSQAGNYKSLRAAFQGFRFQTKRRVTINCNVNFCFRFCQAALCTDKNGRRIMSLGRKRRDLNAENTAERKDVNLLGGTSVQGVFEVLDYRKVPVLIEETNSMDILIIPSTLPSTFNGPHTEPFTLFHWPVVLAAVIVCVIMAIGIVCYYLRRRTTHKCLTVSA